MRPTRPVPRGRRARGTSDRGFTFLEILVVMGMLGVILGLSVGFLGGVGKRALGMQAAAILSESGNRCLNMSAGGRRATLDVRTASGGPDDGRLVVTTSVLKTVLSASFSVPTKEQPGLEYLIHAAGSLEFATPEGNVSIDPEGQSGGALKLTGQGSLDFGARAGYAMTDGFFADLWVKPDGTRGTARLLSSVSTDGQTFWTLDLERVAAGNEAFSVVLTLWLVEADAVREGASVPVRFTTSPAVRPIGARIEASYDGREPSIKVDGIERYVPAAAAAARARTGGTTMRFATTASGVARIRLSDPARPFSGLVDNLTVGGVFRTDEDRRVLPLDVTVVGTKLPWRVPFLNGRLDPSDPTYRTSDAKIHLAGPGDATSGAVYEVRFGRYGSIPPPTRVLLVNGEIPGAAPSPAITR